jgi:hypothetical protein
MARKRLGDVLLEEGLIDKNDLEEALSYKEKSGYRLGTALVALRIIAEWQLTEALGKALEMSVVDLSNITPKPSALKRIPARLAERFDLIPLAIEGSGSDRKLIVAMSDPLNRPVIKRLEDVAGCPVKPVLASLSAIQRYIRRHYHGAARSRVVADAEEMRSSAGDAEVFESLAGMRAQTRQITISNLRRELDEQSWSEQPDLPPPPIDVIEPEPTLALDLKFRALLHLLLKKSLIDGRDYAETLRHLIDSVATEDE